MADIALKDILIGARQEAYRMRHFFVGVEHLFIALLEIRGSIAGNLIQEFGLTPDYVIDAIRRKTGKGGKARLWAGVPNTPRADIVLSIANDLALEHSRNEINERDLLIALLEEEDSIPIRVLRALGLTDTSHLVDLARNYTLNIDSQQPYIKITYSPDFPTDLTLTKDQLFILRRMFYGYDQIIVERHLTGGYSDAMLLVVTPFQGDQREDAPVVVKINHVDDILDEAQRYETHVKTKLPPITARIEDKPIAPETLNAAGIKYSLVADQDRIPRDLRAVIGRWGPERLGGWLRDNLFPAFGRLWWQQNRPFRFQVWREYDWLLPPILTLDVAPDLTESSSLFSLRVPIKRARLRRLDYGSPVRVENFVIQRVYPERSAIRLAIGHGNDAARAYTIEIRGIDLSNTTYYRGEVVESITGTVWQTREQQLVNALRALEPDFDPEADRIRITDDFDIPNPITAYEGLLDSYVNGSLCTIHGDLHPGNIMIGPNHSAFLIDFAHTRDGHTVFDWATLETGFLSDYLMTDIGPDWDDARLAVQLLHKLNGGDRFSGETPGAEQTLAVIGSIREIASRCLASPNKWSEYFVALVFCGLRTLSWETVSVAGRRLMFLVAGLAIQELRTRYRPTSTTETPSPEDTEVNIIGTDGDELSM